MKRAFATVAFVALALGVADAKPGQNEKQLAAWGKSNAALHNFKSAMDQNTAGTVYSATMTVDGKHATFSSEPQGGVVHREYIALVDSEAGYDFTKHLDFTKDAIAVVFGHSVASDFARAKDMTTNHVMIRKGTSFAYSIDGDAVVIFRLADLPEVLKNARECAAFDCAGD